MSNSFKGDVEKNGKMLKNIFSKRKEITLKIKELSMKVTKMQSLLTELEKSLLNTDLRKR